MRLARKDNYVSITPIWLRIGLVAASAAAAIYLAIEDRHPFRAVWLFTGSYQLGFLLTWLIFLVPCLVFIYALATVLHRRRRRQDFPSARVVDR